MNQAMKERKQPTIIQAYIDPFEPPVPPKVDIDFVKELAKSFARGQQYAKRTGLTLYIHIIIIMLMTGKEEVSSCKKIIIKWL
jgi:hypothetical protein